MTVDTCTDGIRDPDNLDGMEQKLAAVDQRVEMFDQQVPTAVNMPTMTSVDVRIDKCLARLLEEMEDDSGLITAAAIICSLLLGSA